LPAAKIALAERFNIGEICSRPQKFKTNRATKTKDSEHAINVKKAWNDQEGGRSVRRFPLTDPLGQWHHLDHHVSTITEDLLTEDVMFDGLDSG
jgi:hypothetical protein